MDEDTIKAVETERAFDEAIRTLAALPPVKHPQSTLDKTRNVLRELALFYQNLEEVAAHNDQDLRLLLGVQED